ncbi:MAG TPA: D-alanyl-D-alanine carboxypeptidase/D-alanyl-D-alanine-endopeptidase [Bacteroidales bacterium]|nr:D-alanyl-D-alanine carboxypeptidase/D-alanyl-D-alanine-endopeptidase [Bacteroidales bacterium]
MYMNNTRLTIFDLYRDARPCVFIFIFLLFSNIPYSVIAQNGSDAKTCMSAYINEFVNDTTFRHAGISICFRDMESGDIIAHYNKNMALGSASVMKLVTTAVALETLGPDFRFSTRIGYVGNFTPGDSILKGCIVIKGGADPTILSEYFPDHNTDIIEKWADAIVNAGIKKVEGSVLADATIFNYHPAPGGWNWSDLGNYYGAGSHGICIFDNMYRIHFKTGSIGTRPEIKGIDPDIPGLIIENRLISYGNSDNGYVYLEPYGDHAVIRGEIPHDRDDFVLKASIPDPPLLTGILLQKELEKRGIIISKKTTSLRITPSLAEEYRSSEKVIITTSWSPPLSDIISVTNTESVNLFAEQLIKYIGFANTMKEFSSKGSGLKAINEYLNSSLDSTEGLYIVDGSGLSRSNALSASFITGLLQYMRTEGRFAEYYYESLPEPGKSGTLENYFNDPVFEGRLRAKSGTSTRIRNYAGYLEVSPGREVIFAVLVNNFDCSSSEVTARVEKLLKGVIEDH